MILNIKHMIKTTSLIFLLSNIFATSILYAKQVKVLYKFEDGKMTVNCSSSDIGQSALPSLCKENTETPVEETADATDPYQEAPTVTTPPADKNTIVFDTTQYLDFSSMSKKELQEILGKGKNKSIYLSDGDDYIDATKNIADISAGDGNDYISASSKNNIINAGNGNDTIIAGEGKDIIYGGAGSDIIDGGDKNKGQEIDSLVYTKPREAYDIKLIGDDTSNGGYLQITDKFTGDVDQVSNIEQLAFGYSNDISDFDMLSLKSSNNKSQTTTVNKYFDNVFLIESIRKNQQDSDELARLLNS